MHVTAIEPQRKDKNRASLYLDGQFHCGLYLDIIWQFHFKVGQTLTVEQIAQAKQADNLQRVYSKALDYLSRRPRTQREMEQYLQQKLIYKHPDWPELAEADKPNFIDNQQRSLSQLMAKLQQQGYLDDLAFANWWIDNRLAFKPRGPRLLQQELQAKGIDPVTINQALSQAHSGPAVDQFAQAQQLAQKYLRKQAEPDQNKLKQKLFRHLASKGYDWDVINQVWSSLVD